MLLRSSEVRLLFIDLYQNSTQHSVVAVVPPPQPPNNQPPPDDESLPRKRSLSPISRTETSALAVSLHLSHPGVQSSGASAEQWAAHDQAAPCTTRGWRILHTPHPSTLPTHFIHTSPFSQIHSAVLTDPPVPSRIPTPFRFRHRFAAYAFCACKHTRLTLYCQYLYSMIALAASIEHSVLV